MLIRERDQGDRVAQLVERRTRDPKEVRILSGVQLQEKIVSFFPLSQKCCADSLSVCPTPMWEKQPEFPMGKFPLGQ